MSPKHAHLLSRSSGSSLQAELSVLPESARSSGISLEPVAGLRSGQPLPKGHPGSRWGLALMEGGAQLLLVFLNGGHFECIRTPRLS